MADLFVDIPRHVSPAATGRHFPSRFETVSFFFVFFFILLPDSALGLPSFVSLSLLTAGIWRWLVCHLIWQRNTLERRGSIKKMAHAETGPLHPRGNEREKENGARGPFFFCCCCSFPFFVWPIQERPEYQRTVPVFCSFPTPAGRNTRPILLGHAEFYGIFAEL